MEPLNIVKQVELLNLVELEPWDLVELVEPKNLVEPDCD